MRDFFDEFFELCTNPRFVLASVALALIMVMVVIMA
jgi:hypothetical protein